MRRAKGDYDRAIVDYTEAIRLNPQSVGGYNNRGNLHKGKGNLKDAIADYQRYIDLGGGEKYGNQEEVEMRIRELQKRLKP